MVCMPVFPNSQHMPDIIRDFDRYLSGQSVPPAYFIAGHGVYSWGKTVLHAKQKLEAIEHLLEIKFMEEG
jgi:methylthioribulose-1-phosphate dehydratase